ncbi:MAG: hypothetical protein H7282_09650 [Cytophagaceae bacterium]|nr:hypothetical protein [Cytophagaceae bacterium]
MNTFSPALCLIPINTCNSDTDDPSANNPFRATVLGSLGDQKDPMFNYMDYENLTCQILFSAEQKTECHCTNLTAIEFFGIFSLQ